MTQKSLPWQGVAPASGADAGRYNAEEWWAVWMSMATSGGVLRDIATPLRTDTTLANKGVFYAVPNRLAVTSGGNNAISIATGAGLVDGQFVYNDAAVALTVPSPAANPRIDRIVLRKNYSAATYTPAGSVDADEQVPALTTRITRLVGAENAVPVAPALTQDATKLTYWDTPLAQYQISVAGVISALTDERDYVDAETKHLTFQFSGGWNTTLGAELGHTSFVHGFRLPETDTATASAVFKIPSDYLGEGVLTPVVVKPTGGAAGDYYMSFNFYYGECGQDYDIHFTGSGDTVITASGGDILQCLTDISLNIPASATINDIASVNLIRTGGSLSDTAGNCNAYFVIIEYLGWRR